MTFGRLIIAIALAGIGAPAMAQSCLDREDLVDALRDRWQEVPRVQAVMQQGLLFEIFQGPSGSWTAVIARPDGVSCPVAAGQGLHVVRTTPGDPT